MRGFVLLLIVAITLSGCTFATIEPDPQRALAPPNKPRFIVLGHVQAANPAWEPYREDFAQGFAEWFKRNPGVPDALTDRAARFPDDAVILMGSISDVEEGNSALRWLVGMGAGQAHVKGDFEIVDATGKVLTRFTARESYLGGVGIGGPGFLNTGDLVRRFSETVAKSTRKWANGEPLD
jgi:hypothetical protein